MKEVVQPGIGALLDQVGVAAEVKQRVNLHLSMSALRAWQQRGWDWEALAELLEVDVDEALVRPSAKSVLVAAGVPDAKAAQVCPRSPLPHPHGPAAQPPQDTIRVLLNNSASPARGSWGGSNTPCPPPPPSPSDWD